MNNLLNKIIDNDKDKQIILDEINKLSPEQQNFIHQESDTLLELNNEIIPLFERQIPIDYKREKIIMKTLL